MSLSVSVLQVLLHLLNYNLYFFALNHYWILKRRWAASCLHLVGLPMPRLHGRSCMCVFRCDSMDKLLNNFWTTVGLFEHVIFKWKLIFLGDRVRVNVVARPDLYIKNKLVGEKMKCSLQFKVWSLNHMRGHILNQATVTSLETSIAHSDIHIYLFICYMFFWGSC